MNNDREKNIKKNVEAPPKKVIILPLSEPKKRSDTNPIKPFKDDKGK